MLAYSIYTRYQQSIGFISDKAMMICCFPQRFAAN
jgi:hypothetical protein